MKQKKYGFSTTISEQTKTQIDQLLSQGPRFKDRVHVITVAVSELYEREKKLKIPTKNPLDG